MLLLALTEHAYISIALMLNSQSYSVRNLEGARFPLYRGRNIYTVSNRE